MRLQIDISSKEKAVIENLMTATGITKKKELFNNALALLDWVVEEKKSGRSIASIDKNEETVRELIMPIMKNLQ